MTAPAATPPVPVDLHRCIVIDPFEGEERLSCADGTARNVAPRCQGTSVIQWGVMIDLVFIPDFRERLEVGAGAIVHSAFRSSEIRDQQPEHLAGLWAAKKRPWSRPPSSHPRSGSASSSHRTDLASLTR
jgi:hypothetical protein